jgi:hypothetical protein
MMPLREKEGRTVRDRSDIVCGDSSQVIYTERFGRFDCVDGGVLVSS